MSVPPAFTVYYTDISAFPANTRRTCATCRLTLAASPKASRSRTSSPSPSIFRDVPPRMDLRHSQTNKRRCGQVLLRLEHLHRSLLSTLTPARRIFGCPAPSVIAARERNSMMCRSRPPARNRVVSLRFSMAMDPPYRVMSILTLVSCLGQSSRAQRRMLIMIYSDCRWYHCQRPILLPCHHLVRPVPVLSSRWPFGTCIPCHLQPQAGKR